MGLVQLVEFYVVTATALAMESGTFFDLSASRSHEFVDIKEIQNGFAHSSSSGIR